MCVTAMFNYQCQFAIKKFVYENLFSQLYWMVLFPIMKIISYKWCVVKEHNINLLNENYL
jgi:hypothetical protein